MDKSSQVAEACPSRRQYLARREHLAEGGITRGALTRLLRDQGLIRVRRGVYCPALLPRRAKHLLSGGAPDPAYVAEVRAVLLSLGTGCAAGCRTAAVLWGMDMFVEPSKVEVVVPRSRTGVAMTGVQVRRSVDPRLVKLEVLGLEALWVTSAVQTVVDCAMTLPLREAVVIADSALRAGLVTAEELIQAVAALPRRPGVRRARRVLDLMDPKSGSVLESLFRVLAMEAGYVPTSQFVVRTRAGGRVGRFDFCFEGARLIVECDGRQWHDPEDVREKDRKRENELERLRWRLLRFTWNEVVHEPAYVLGLLRDCLVADPDVPTGLAA